MKTAYLGAKNSHTYAAAYKIFSSQSEYMSFATIRKCIEALDTGITDFCVVPIENSVEGTVVECIEALRDYTVYIIAETVLKISHNLICQRGAKKEDIKAIYSHPQALSQCRNFLETNFANASLTAVSSTSEGVDKIKSISDAAIARQGHEDLEVMFSSIEDYTTNETRFIILKKSPKFEGEKCSLMFEAADKPGELFDILEKFKSYNLNMTKIESRPIRGKLGKYVFFVDFTIGGGQKEITDFLAVLQKRTNMLKFLGKYKTV